MAHEATVGSPDEDVVIPDVEPERVRDRAPGSRGDAEQGGAGRRPPKGPRPGATRLWISVGRAAGIRPADLVGAIAGESSLTGRDIGGIEITERFSFVEVPDAAVDEVTKGLERSRIKGRKVSVRPDRGRP
ncbi:hypothetical protein GCM10025868_26100 [Angustibacter aerolatus]|uniref:DEAD box helicase DbpA/CsdA RNA-binding domain-containing protein n=1 Tax=Angustibacter aerolatus TaxID=1162965 RepID=A0ABQ6JGP1_9ACTN|nr:DbpA RNA binding domain-containing protein [Angustibacter aerolatus]GMA87360.1 hypothetical protein GCM10025868_26100 [Angustibacter aerolatus]